jgi:hypothetical protein
VSGTACCFDGAGMNRRRTAQFVLETRVAHAFTELEYRLTGVEPIATARVASLFVGSHAHVSGFDLLCQLVRVPVM